MGGPDKKWVGGGDEIAVVSARISELASNDDDDKDRTFTRFTVQQKPHKLANKVRP